MAAIAYFVAVTSPKSPNIPRPTPSQPFANQVVHASSNADGAPARRFLDRKQLAFRWQSSISTLKRREAAGELKPTRLGPRTIRYAMAHILEIEERGI